MKKGLIPAVAIFAIAAMIYGITEHQGKEVYREENNRLREELRKVNKEAVAARLEAAKLRNVILAQTKRNEELLSKKK